MEIWSVLLGWLLGILSPGIVGKISIFYKKKSLKKVIISELTDVKQRLSPVPLRVLPAYGSLDVATFRWVKEQTNNFSSNASAEERTMLSSYDLDDEQRILDVVNIFNHQQQRENPAFNFKKIDLSIFDSNLNNIEALDGDFLAKILEIKFQIKSYNEEISLIDDYLKMTFDSNISTANHAIIEQEIKKKNIFISDKAKYTVEKINKVIT